ncbi:MAG: T9SS type A sorting domain-containing protein [Bacteroidetes bacterium]|nr:T9SS type A sorting domain-containing protein [Bacteroidota bacterium]
MKKFENLKKNRLYKNVELIKLGNIAKLSKTNNGALPIKIPGVNKSFVAKSVEIEYSSEENFVWKGEFKKEEGYIKLICRDGEMFGNIQVKGRFFEIQAFESGKNVVIEYDETELSKMTCGNIHEEANKTESTSDDKILKSATATTTRSTVRVLVLFTDAAEAAVANINNTASLAISQMNDAISNSDVNSSLYMSLAGVEHLDFTENTSNIVADVDNLSTNADAANLRNTNEADLVVLLTDGNYTDGYYTYYGIVDNIGPINADAFSIVEADVSTSSKYTFAHEVCHLFGGRHDNDPSGTYEHGYTFKTGIWPFRKTRTTIMYWTPGDYILHYSNPDVEYKNKATGTTSSNDVVRKLEIEASTVEVFRAFTPPLNAYISGPTKGNNSGTYTWYAVVSNGILPYSYLWEYSLDGFNYTGTLGTSSSVTAPLPLDNDLFLRLTVTSADGQTDVDFHSVINMDAGFSLKSAETSSDSIENQIIAENRNIDIFESSPNITIYPNPVRNIATISYYVNTNCKVSIEVFDINGKKVETILKSIQDKGKYLTQLNTNRYRSGIYFCKLSFNGQSYSNKIIVE